MLQRFLFAGVIGLLLSADVARAQVAESDKVLDRFVGAWRNEISRVGPESPERRKLTSQEVIEKSLKGKWLVGREVNPQSGVKFMWFMTYDPQSEKYAWTFFNTQGLVGTEWKGTWNGSTNSLTSKSSDAPATWTSESVSRFVSKDTAESSAWMKDDKGKVLFEMSVTKSRQPAEAVDTTLAAWSADATPTAELSPERKVLDRLAGTWDVTSLAKKAEWTPQETRTKSKVVRSWVLNRTYLQDVSKHEDGTEGLSLFTYDQKRSEYRSWWFSSTGSSSKSTGQWDAASNSIRWKGTLPEGQTSTSSVHITDEAHHEWKVLITDASGKVYFDCVWNCVRAKP